MNTNARAADEVFHMAMSGVRFAVRLTGKMAKYTGIMLAGALDQMNNGQSSTVDCFLKQNKEINIFRIAQKDKDVLLEFTDLYQIPFCMVNAASADREHQILVLVPQKQSGLVIRYLRGQGIELGNDTAFEEDVKALAEKSYRSLEELRMEGSNPYIKQSFQENLKEKLLSRPDKAKEKAMVPTQEMEYERG